MASVQNARRTLGTVMMVLAVVDVAALLFLLTPWGFTRRRAENEYQTTRAELRAKIDETAPLRGIDKKLGDAQGELTAFYKDRLPSEYSAISAELGKVAAQNHVRISAGKYETDVAELPGLQRVRMDAMLEGDYSQIVRFINALERDRIFFIVDSVNLGQEQGGAVRLNLKLETYRKAGEA